MLTFRGLLLAGVQWIPHLRGTGARQFVANYCIWADQRADANRVF